MQDCTWHVCSTHWATRWTTCSLLNLSTDKKLIKELPCTHPLSELEIRYYAKKLNIPHFRGVFCQNNLPKHPLKCESAIINLDFDTGPGTHWVAYYTYVVVVVVVDSTSASTSEQRHVVYYDSSGGNLNPPTRLMKYFGYDARIRINRLTYQKPNTHICGQLCLSFLYNNTNSCTSRK